MQATASSHPDRHLFSSSLLGRSPKPRRAPACAVRMSLREDGPSVAVVGVTGAVGQEFLSILSYRSIKMLASRRSAGKKLSFEDREYVVEELRPESFDGVDIALFSAGGSISKEMGPPQSRGGRSSSTTAQRSAWFPRCRWLYQK